MQAYGQPAPHVMSGPAVADAGLFGKLPCPHCGMPTTSNSGGGGTAARMAGGLVGWLIVSAFTTKYYCTHHGEIPIVHFPPGHQSAISTRKATKIVGGVALLFVVFALMIVASLIR